MVKVQKTIIHEHTVSMSTNKFNSERYPTILITLNPKISIVYCSLSIPFLNIEPSSFYCNKNAHTGPYERPS